VISRVAKKALYASGALHAWHARRNEDRLTVVMFHRVLATSDARWAVADPEYTLSEELFGQSLDFLGRHYSVVALSDVLAARAGARTLPRRALLVTFDDGWSDTAEYALPLMRRAGMPSVVFVAGAAVGRAEAFWQEQLMHAWRAGRLDARRAGSLWRAATPAEPPPFGARRELDGIRAVIDLLERTPTPRRDALLAGLGDVLADPAHHMMMTPEQLRGAAAGDCAIGAHGYSHEPLTRTDAAAELALARDALERHVALAPALSFPHGKFDAAVVECARSAGFQLLFTSVPELSPANARGPGLVGRIGFTGEMITEGGRFAPEKLALHLFRKPHRGR